MVIAESGSSIGQREIEIQAEHILGAHPDCYQLRQLPGVGLIVALTILAEAGDLAISDIIAGF